MTHIGNARIRRERTVSAALTIITGAFIILSSTGLVFPRAEAPDTVTVTFDVGDRLESGEEADISAAADALLDAPGTIAIVTGHTGPKGDAAANLDLSLARAEAVSRALVEAGIPAERIRTRGAGGTAGLEPREGETPASLSARLKRAEIRIVERALLAGGGQ